MADRLAVIKTGWCASYDGGDAEGNFGHLIEGGEGAERFNMRRTGGGYEVYALPKAEEQPPRPVPSDKWTIVHVARDPAEAKMKIVGWYEDAKFLRRYKDRDDADGVDRSIYCIEAARAFELLPEDRPIIDHDGRFGSSGIFWLRGNTGWKGKSWDKIARRIEKAVGAARGVALPGGRAGRAELGDTREAAASADGIEIDDGGVPYGHSSIAESPEHEALRLWAKANPEAVTGRNKAEKSKTEWRLPSGDEVDAMHRFKKELWVIEAKSRRSGEQDLERGIYQCVKYRAVADAAQKGSPKRRKVYAVLLTERKLSERLRALAKRHRVIHVKHPKDAS